MKVGLPLMKRVPKSFAKSVLIPLRLTAASSAAEPAICKKNFGSGTYGSATERLTISNKEMEDITKIVKFLEDSGLLIKSITKTIENETKQQRHAFLSR